MSIARFQQLTILLAAVIGPVAAGGGIYNFTDLIAAAVNLGLRVHSTSLPAVPFIYLIGARNLSIGLSLLALIYTK